jgi:hypothetical protein
MGLGGTSKFIPPPILSVVANTQILGVTRFLSVSSANMLSSAQEMCSQLLRRRFGVGAAQSTLKSSNPEGSWNETAYGGSLLPMNGDAELWAHLCTMDNPIPVRVIQVATQRMEDEPKLYTYYAPASRLPTTRAFPLGNDRGGVDMGLLPNNLMSWCIIKPTGFNSTPESVVAQQAYIDAHHAADGQPLPICPDELFPTHNPFQDRMFEAALDQWATRGAVNAGFSVFLYLDRVMRGTIKRVPDYDHCEQLP